MMYLNKPVYYLTDGDVDSSGNLINPDIPKDIPVFLMLQAGFCGHCTVAKPAYQEFANKNEGKVFVTTVQADGKESGEKDLAKRLGSLIPNFRGYPHYAVYKNGTFLKNWEEGRSLDSLEKCLTEL